MVEWHGKGLMIPTSYISLLSDCLTGILATLWVSLEQSTWVSEVAFFFYTNITHSTPSLYSAIPKSLLERKHKKSF